MCERVLVLNHIIAAPRAGGTTVDGPGVDSSGFDGVRMAVPCSSFTGGGSTVDCKLQESDDNSVFTDIPGAASAQQTTGTPIPTVDVRLGGRADRKKWVRARLAITGLGATAGVMLDLYGAEAAAVVNTPAAVVV